MLQPSRNMARGRTAEQPRRNHGLRTPKRPLTLLTLSQRERGQFPPFLPSLNGRGDNSLCLVLSLWEHTR